MQEASSEGTGAGPSQSARVRYGVHNKQGDLAGKTIGQVRAEVGRKWKLPEDASGFVGTTKLEDDYVIKPGESVEFHRRQGEKG